MQLDPNTKKSAYKIMNIEVSKPEHKSPVRSKIIDKNTEDNTKGINNNESEKAQIKEQIKAVKSEITTNNIKKVKEIKPKNTIKIAPKPIPKEKPVLAKDVLPLLNQRMEELATTILGGKNKSMSRGNQLRFGKHGSISVNTDSAKWYSHETGEGGDAFKLIQEYMPNMSQFKDALEYAKHFTGYRPDLVYEEVRKPQQQKVDNSKEWSTNYAKNLYDHSKHIHNTVAETYLKKRGLHEYHHANAAFISAVPAKVNGQKQSPVPALLAFAKDKDNRLHHVQVIRLDQDGNKNKSLDVVKQVYGESKGVGIELNRNHNGEVTYLSEGIETGLSLLAVNKKAQVLAVLGRSNFANIDLDNLTQKVVIALDNDGLKSLSNAQDNNRFNRLIFEAVERIQKAGKDVSLIIPDQYKQDFNDILSKQGISELNKQVNREISASEFIKITNKSSVDMVDKATRKIDEIKNQSFDFKKAFEHINNNRNDNYPSDLAKSINRDQQRNMSSIKGKTDKDTAYYQNINKHNNQHLADQVKRDQIENISTQKTQNTKGIEKEL